MKKIISWFGLVIGLAVVISGPSAARTDDKAAKPLVMFDFEDGLQGWVIPAWSLQSADYAGKSVQASAAFASHGKQSLELTAALPGEDKWTAAYAEVEMHVTDWGVFSEVAADVYLPEQAPRGLAARLIVTVGDQWQWTEQNHPVKLVPGQWVTLTANLTPNSMDWKFFLDESFRRDVRKLGVRIESDKKPTYSGPVYIDQIRLSP